MGDCFSMSPPLPPPLPPPPPAPPPPSDPEKIQQQLDKAIAKMMGADSYSETKQLVVLVRNGCGNAFRGYIEALSLRFNILVPDDGIMDNSNDARNMVPKLIEMALAQDPRLLVTNSRGIGYAHQALKSIHASVSRQIAVLELSSGSHLGPNLLEEHPGRVVCLHGRHDNCTDIQNLRNAFENRRGNEMEPAVLFEIMNRGHQKKHGWELGGLAHWVLHGQQFQSSHECIHFPDNSGWPNAQEETKWRAWFRNVCQADPDLLQVVSDWRNG